jgi:pimeloyl-ACP methyl ester carboxylesterase
MRSSAARPFDPDGTDVPPPIPPAPGGSLGELRAALQVGRLAAATPRLRRLPRGGGAPVVLVPGWKAPHASMEPLRRFLQAKGYDARHWSLGTNEGLVERDAPRLAASLEALTAEVGQPAALVGWSLGGVIAREVAREAPELVRQVLTYGTPVVGGPTYTLGAGSFGHRESARIAAVVEEADRERPIQVPLTAIFTRQDRVVSWSACIDRASRDVTHVEVGSTHLGMGVDPDVWAVIATRLRAPST